YVETFDHAGNDLVQRTPAVDELQRCGGRWIEHQRAFGNEQHGGSIAVAAQHHALAQRRSCRAVHTGAPDDRAVASNMHHSTSHLKRSASTQRSSISGVVASASTQESAQSASLRA